MNLIEKDRFITITKNNILDIYKEDFMSRNIVFYNF